MTIVDIIMTLFLPTTSFLDFENGLIEFPDEFPMGDGIIFVKRVQAMARKVHKWAICGEKGQKRHF